MRRLFNLQAAVFIAVFVPSLAAQTVQANAVGDDGKPLQAVVQFLPLTPAAAGPPRFTNSLADGALSIPNLPPGAYEVCIQVPAGGYVNPCQWPALKITFNQSALGSSSVQLVAKKWAVLTVNVADPGGVTAANPTIPLVVGVFAPGGLFYPMRAIPNGGSLKIFSETIPFRGNPECFSPSR